MKILENNHMLETEKKEKKKRKISQLLEIEMYY